MVLGALYPVENYGQGGGKWGQPLMAWAVE